MSEMRKLEAVACGERQKRTVMVGIKLSAKHRQELEAYLDHLGLSINTFVRRLVLEELAEERLNYDK
jgi:hypothetical protein